MEEFNQGFWLLPSTSTVVYHLESHRLRSVQENSMPLSTGELLPPDQTGSQPTLRNIALLILVFGFPE